MEGSMVTTRYNHAESNPKSYERNSIMWDEYSQVTAGATRVDQVIARPNVSEFPLGTFGDMTVGDQVFIWSPRSNRDRISDASVKSGIYTNSPSTDPQMTPEIAEHHSSVIGVKLAGRSRMLPKTPGGNRDVGGCPCQQWHSSLLWISGRG